MTPEQTKRVREIAENKTRKFCIETNMEYMPNFMYMANIAILSALDDPLLTGKDLTKFEPDWVDYRSGFDCGYAEAKEQAAQVCEQPSDEIQVTDELSKYTYKDCFDCAAAIRVMKKECGK
jgi:hypothetical protein